MCTVRLLCSGSTCRSQRSNRRTASRPFQYHLNERTSQRLYVVAWNGLRAGKHGQVLSKLSNPPEITSAVTPSPLGMTATSGYTLTTWNYFEKKCSWLPWMLIQMDRYTSCECSNLFLTLSKIYEPYLPHMAFQLQLYQIMANYSWSQSLPNLQRRMTFIM